MKFINILTKLMYPIRKERFVMKIYSVIILLLLFMGCNKNDTNETTALNKTNPIGNYGKMIELKTAISIDKLLAKPEAYLEKKVMLEGTISAVCPKRGCWMDIKSTETNSELRLKVTDGEIVFPLSGKGKDIKAEGIFQKLEFTNEQVLNRKIHFAVEKGVTLHPDSVHITPKDLTSYRVYVSGAVIE